MTLILGDCLVELKNIADKSVDMVYLDLPFCQTACEWDRPVDLKALWVELKRVARSERTGFFFSCTTKFGFELFNNSPKGYFRWDLVWEKNRAAGFLNAYRLPMRKHEMIYCFAKKTPEYDVSSHSEVEKLIGGGDEMKSTGLVGTPDQRKNKIKYGKDGKGGKLHKERLPTSVLPPEEDHELIYCFAKKTPAYDVSSHKEFIEVSENRIAPKAPIYNLPGGKTHKLYKDPLPTSILPPEGDHELIYCFAKKTPAYDVSSHNEYTEQPNALERPMTHYAGLKVNNAVKSKTHKVPLPTSILPPEEDHELIYCFAKKTPAYDVSSHSEVDIQKNGRKTPKNAIYGTHNINTDDKVNRVHKERLPTSVLPQEDTPSSWCKYDVDGKTKHRTSKPVKLMEFLLKYWSKEGDTILDPTFGSGAMAVACQNMKRKFIGIEMCAEFHELATERLKANALLLE